MEQLQIFTNMLSGEIRNNHCLDTYHLYCIRKVCLNLGDAKKVISASLHGKFSGLWTASINASGQDMPTKYSRNGRMEINQSSVTTFILLGFSKLPQLGILLFTLFFIIYSLSIVGNLLIVLLVVADHCLHTPMYFFLVNLSCLETCYISTILPRMLASFVTEDKSISVYGCMTQYYFFGFLASTECYLLAMMSYDRYLAICKPLHYASFMNGKLCLQLAFTSWISGLLTNTVVTAFLLQLNFCGPNEIDHFFCDVYPVANLSCSNTHLVKLATFILGFMSIGIPFLLTMTSYIYILYTVWQMKSKKAQQKAFSTCSSHLTVVLFFFVSLLLVYVVPETERLKELHKIFSLFYTVLTPMVNPIIYSLRNREVKEAFFKIVRKYSNIVL